MRSNQSKLWAMAAAASLGLCCFGALQFATAEAPPPPPDEFGGAREARTISGRLGEFLRNDHDDVDGFSLSGGGEVHFPPHVGRTVAARFKAGDQVQVQGRDEVRPRGEKVFEAVRITSGETVVNVDPPREPGGKRGPRPPREANEEPMNAKGTVRSYATNPDGDVDGLILADGVEVKMPPHQGEELQRLVSKGDEVRVEGRRHETPEGDVHLHADRVTVISTGKSIERDEPRDRRPPPRGKRGPAADRGPERGPGRGPAAGPGTEADRPEPPHEEILRELREIRRLIEAQSRK